MIINRLQRWSSSQAIQYRDVLEQHIKELGPELSPTRYYFSGNTGVRVTTTKEETEQWLVDVMGFGRVKHPAQGLGSFPLILAHKRRRCPVKVRSESWGATIVMLGAVCPQLYKLVQLFSEACQSTMELRAYNFGFELLLSPDIEAGMPKFPPELGLTMQGGRWLNDKLNMAVEPITDPKYVVRYKLYPYLLE